MLTNSLRSILKNNKITLKKSLGQNFLNNNDILKNLISFINPLENDIFLEIGSGIGTLTFPLCRKAKKVFAIETDRRLIAVAEELKQESDNIEFIKQDILKTDLEDFFDNRLSPGEKTRVTGNLPYYISTPILFELLKVKRYVSDIIIMLQKELAARILAEPGTKDYGSLTVLLQTYADIKVGFEVKRTCFYPQPKVDSAVIKITPLPAPRIEIKDYDLFSKLVKTSFAQRRKTLRNNLKNLDEVKKSPHLIDMLLSSSGIDPELRAETLSVFDFKKLYDSLLEIGYK